jgi:hypothetical protein
MQKQYADNNDPQHPEGLVSHSAQDQQGELEPMPVPTPVQNAPLQPKRGRERPRKVAINQPASQLQTSQTQPPEQVQQAAAPEQPKKPIMQARTHVLKCQALSGMDAVKVIQQVNPKVCIIAKFKPIPHYNPIEAPDFVANENRANQRPEENSSNNRPTKLPHITATKTYCLQDTQVLHLTLWHT